jgi:hypothetical protein
MGMGAGRLVRFRYRSGAASNPCSWFGTRGSKVQILSAAAILLYYSAHERYIAQLRSAYVVVPSNPLVSHFQAKYRVTRPISPMSLLL